MNVKATSGQAPASAEVAALASRDASTSKRGPTLLLFIYGKMIASVWRIGQLWGQLIDPWQCLFQPAIMFNSTAFNIACL